MIAKSQACVTWSLLPNIMMEFASISFQRLVILTLLKQHPSNAIIIRELEQACIEGGLAFRGLLFSCARLA